MLLEAIIGIAVLIFVGSLVLGLLKLVFTVVLLPLKLMLLLTQGLLGLVIGLPLLVLGALVFGVALPVVLIVVLAPVWILGGIACAVLS